MTALRATLSADDEQHKAAAPLEGAAYDQEEDLSGALPGAHHVLEDLHAMENSQEGRAGLPHASIDLGTSANGQKGKSLLDTHFSTTGPRGTGETLPGRSESTGTPAAAQSSGQHRPLSKQLSTCLHTFAQCTVELVSVRYNMHVGNSKVVQSHTPVLSS